MVDYGNQSRSHVRAKLSFKYFSKVNVVGVGVHVDTQSDVGGAGQPAQGLWSADLWGNR